MSDLRLRLHAPQAAHPTEIRQRPLGRALVEAGILTSQQLLEALQLQTHQDAPLGEILVSRGMASQDQVLQAVARQHGLHVVDLELEPSDPTLTRLMTPEFWLRNRVIPWMMLGKTLVMATARPDLMEKVRAELPKATEQVLVVVAPETQIMAALSQRYTDYLATRAERRVHRDLSCRTWSGVGKRTINGLVILAIATSVATVLSPLAVFSALCGLAILSLILITCLKLSALCTRILTSLHDLPTKPEPLPANHRLPKVSVMVPLYRETEIATALVQRLSRLTYPKVLLEVVLVLEERDEVTKSALAATGLPPWMRVVEVPYSGGITTKPRALNYALDFCQGDIIGIWDAEDAPAPDQIDHVVTRFAQAPADVICLQGVLDYYNPRSNWIARCFTIEYAGWWRVILPGIARMGLVIPLGGTTLFIKRAELEELGGWDAHNVTEDADLGVRLSRFGYRTELIQTVTHEEANCRPWPWVKQRSRWLKGFMVTYLVHMRNPRQLLQDLGWRKFLGVQAFFIGTVSQFIFAPLLWSFWLILLGVPHPITSILPDIAINALITLFLITELTNVAIGWIATSGREHRFLLGWVLTMPLYYPMGALASYKALFELVFRPFYWDKTQHGQAKPDQRSCPTETL